MAPKVLNSYVMNALNAHSDNTGRSKFFVTIARRAPGSRKAAYFVRAFVPALSDTANQNAASAALRADGWSNIVGQRHLNAIEVARVEVGGELFAPGESWL